MAQHDFRQRLRGVDTPPMLRQPVEQFVRQGAANEAFTLKTPHRTTKLDPRQGGHHKTMSCRSEHEPHDAIAPRLADVQLHQNAGVEVKDGQRLASLPDDSLRQGHARDLNRVKRRHDRTGLVNGLPAAIPAAANRLPCYLTTAFRSQAGGPGAPALRCSEAREQGSRFPHFRRDFFPFHANRIRPGPAEVKPLGLDFTCTSKYNGVQEEINERPHEFLLVCKKNFPVTVKMTLFLLVINLTREPARF